MLVLLLPILLGNASGCGPADPEDFIVISDVHFNPFDDTALFNRLVVSPAEDWADIFTSSSNVELPDYGSESNFTLLTKALDSAMNKANVPAMVIFPGDILRHNFNTEFYRLYGSNDEAALKSFILKTVQFFVLQISERFPYSPVLFTLGNNDAYAGDYNLETGGAFLAETASLFQKQWLNRWVRSSEFNETYKAGGYYAADSNRDNIRLISLNSVLFSTRRPAPAAGDAAYTQLDWFEGQLAAARNADQQIYVVTHVPPGTDIYSTITSYMDAQGAISDVKDMWHDAYQTRFLQIMNSYDEVKVTFFAGHTHMDEFRLIYNNARTGTPDTVFVHPAISPIFGNNPGYKLFKVDAKSWIIEDYTTNVMSLESTNKKFIQEYRFSTRYSLNTPVSQNMATLSDALALGGANKTAYTEYYYSGSSRSAITDTNWHAYRCSTGYVRAPQYQACVNASVP